MTGLSEYEDWLDELDKKLFTNKEGIVSLFGPNPYFVKFTELNSDSEVLAHVLNLTLSQIDYLPNSDYLARSFIRHAYLQNDMFKPIKDPYQVYRWHELQELNAGTKNEVKYFECASTVIIESNVDYPSLKIKRNNVSNTYEIERLVGGKKDSTRRAEVESFTIYTSENYVVILLPELSEWALYVGGILQEKESEFYNRIAINCKYYKIDKNNLLKRLSEIYKYERNVNKALQRTGFKSRFYGLLRKLFHKTAT